MPKRVNKPVDRFDHTNVMGHGLWWIISFPLAVLVGFKISWYALPLWVILNAVMYYVDSTEWETEEEQWTH